MVAYLQKGLQLICIYAVRKSSTEVEEDGVRRTHETKLLGDR